MIMIRNITANDFYFIYSLYMHPQVNPFLLYENMDAQSFEHIFNDLLEKNIIYVFEADGVAVGMFKFIPQLYRTAHVAYLGGLAIDPSSAGKGYGLQMMNEIIVLGKQMSILRIELGVDVINAKAIHLYEKAGFAKEGILRKYTWLKTENRFLDEYMMSYLYQ